MADSAALDSRLMKFDPRICMTVIRFVLLARFCWVMCHACEFPVYLHGKNNSTSGTEIASPTGNADVTVDDADTVELGWHGHIRDQNTKYGFLLEAERNKVRLKRPEDGAVVKTMICLKRYHGDRYFVGQEERGVAASRFLCVHFVRRSADVVQLRSTSPEDRMNQTFCLEESFVLDPWIFVRQPAQGGGSGRVERAPCALRGGFSVRIFDPSTNQRVCDGFRGEIRMESDCFDGDGMYFNFRYASCVPETLYMYPVQRVLCLASWTDGPTTFTLIRHDRLPYMWLLRSPSHIEDSFTAYLLTHLASEDSSEFLTKSSGSRFRLDVVRDIPVPVTSLCIDDHDVCSVWRDPCKSGAEMALRCPRSCGICNSTRPAVCTFPRDIRDVWNDGTEGGQNRMFVEIADSAIVVTSGRLAEKLFCIQWHFSSDKRTGNKFSSDILLASEFPDGCRPRYTCARIIKKSTSVMFLKFSHSKSWPLTSHLSEPIDCRGFNFLFSDGGDDDDRFRTRHFRLLYAKNKHVAVNCHLPNEMTTYHVTLRDGSECSGRLGAAEVQTRFSLALTGCPVDKKIASTYECLESTLLLPPSDLLVVTGSVTPGVKHSVEIFCWFFLSTPKRLVFLLDAADCDESTKRRLLHNQVVPLAAFSRFPRRFHHDRTVSRDRLEPDDVTDHMGLLLRSFASDDNKLVIARNASDAKPEVVSQPEVTANPEVTGSNAFVYALAGLLLAMLQCIYFCGLS